MYWENTKIIGTYNEEADELKTKTKVKPYNKLISFLSSDMVHEDWKTTKRR